MKTKQLIKTFLFLLFAVQVSAQTIKIPLSRGGANSGGTILSVDVTNGNSVATPMVGSLQTNESDIPINNFVPTENSGIHYESSNNSLYITAKKGARIVGNSAPSGAIFKYDITTKKTTLIKQFGLDRTEGASPFGAVQKIGTKLYGVTAFGGEFNHGTIFSIDPASDTYKVLFSFNGTTDGGEPTCQLFVEGNTLYGGGKRGNGDNGETYFSYNVDSDAYSALFVGTSTATATIRSVFKRNDVLYTTLVSGIYQLDLINPLAGTTSYFVGLGANQNIGYDAYRFTYRNGDGNWYAIFEKGGANGHGSIARFNFGSTNMSNVHSFQGGALGQSPTTKLTDGLNGDIYGTAPTGTGDEYVLYKFSSIGLYSILHTFNSSTEGLSITAPPVLVGGKLYGISEKKGLNGGGTIWSYDFTNGLFDVEKQLGFTDGKSPVGALTESTTADEYIYSTYQGGESAKGTINKFDAANNTTTLVTSINAPTITSIINQPFLVGGKYYVFANFNNSGLTGSYFGLAEIDTTTGLINGTPALVSPGAGIGNIGSFNYSSLIEESGMLYGASLSHLWSINISSGQFTVLYSFSPSADGNTTGTLIKDGNTFYGINEAGGTNSLGTIFKFDGTTYTVLANLDASKTYASLALDGNTLYTIESDTTTKLSSLVKMDVSITNPPITSVQALDKTTYGTNPQGDITLENGIIYGILRENGPNGFGSLFSYDTAGGGTLKNILAFDATTGNYSYNGEMTYISSNLSVSDLIKENIEIYPNPTSGFIKIKSTDIDKVEVFTVTGKRVLKVNKPTNTIDLTSFNNGIYLLKLHKQGSVFTSKVILNK